MTKGISKIPGSRKRFRDPIKEKRIFEHLTVQSDLITDDDIRNVITDSSMLDADNEAGDNFQGNTIEEEK